MSKNLKKTISLLLTIGMLSSSAGIMVSAEDTAAAAPATEAAATTAPAATEAAATEAPAATTEATTAPTVAPTAAPTEAPEAIDAYLEESLGLVTALKIVQGYEDGSIKPENTITRAEMATMILRMMGVDTLSTTYANTFTDVTASHWAANAIQTAYNMGIINGMGDGTFAPDANVTYAQAVKMLVCSLKYEQLAQTMGGYPVGYLTAAAQKNIEVTKNVTGYKNDEPATRGMVIKMIYNTLNALYPTGDGLTADGVEFKTQDGVTLASELLDIHEVEGIITATSTMSIDSAADPADDQLLIDGELYYKGDFDANDYVGYKVKAYYHEKDDSGIRTIVHAVLNTKQDTLTLDAEDVDEIEDIRSDSAKINYFTSKSSSKTKAAKCKSPTVIYNGKIITASDIPDDKTFEEFITPDVGEIVLNDYDNDGYYDVVFIKSYKTYVVTSATASAINNKYLEKLNVDLDEGDLDLTITKEGEEITSKKLKKWDVLTVLESANTKGDRLMTIEVCEDTIEGKVTEVEADKEEREYYAEIDGKKYEIDETFYLNDPVSVGDEGTFHLDTLGRIAAVEGASGSKLASGEEYGWMIWAKQDTSTQDRKLKIYTASGAVKSYEFADKMSFFGPDTKTAINALEDVTEENWKYDWTMDDLEDADWSDEKTLKINDEEDDWKEFLMAEDVMELNLAADFYQMKLVKYSVDSKGRVKSLAMPIVTGDYTYEDEDRPVILNANMDGVDGGGNLLGNQYVMSGELDQIVAPEKLADVNDTDTYKYEKVQASNYIAREGVSQTFFLAEFDGLKPTLIVKYIGASSEPSDYTYNSADDTPLMMISKIQSVYDETEEEDVYKITGYANGNKVTYTTSKTTSISQCNATGGVAGGDTRTYAHKKLWSAVSSEYEGDDAPECTRIKDAIKVGDIVGIKTSGTKINTMVKFVDAEAAEGFDFGVVPSAISCLTAGDLNGRDGFGGGKVADIETDDTLVISIKNGSNISVDPGYYVDVYNVKTGEVEEGELVSDLIPFDDEEGTGDVVIARTYRMGIREIYAIRFE